MLIKLKHFMGMPMSRKRQHLGFTRDKLITRWVYGWRLLSLGKRSLVGKPLFWTPEYIHLGHNVLIWPGCRIEGVNVYASQVFQPEIFLEDGVTLQQRCHITAAGKLVIGANTTISFDVYITDIDHQYQNVNEKVYCQPLDVLETHIGEGCFIGAGAKILAGTKLGKKCVVGANAVVRGVYPDYCVLGGVPAKVIKRFDATTKQWVKTDKYGNFLE